MFKFLKLFFMFTLLSMGNSIYADGLPELCDTECVVKYGEVLGKSMSGVEAYSNCSSRCVNPIPFFVNKTFTGIKWQCVEYARRWLLMNQGVVYGDVDVAADIWQLESVTSPDKKIQKDFLSILNGDTQQFIQRGDLVIYSRAFLGTGHVAVIVELDAKNQRVYLAEQNFDNTRWQGDSARSIPYVIHEGGIWLLDPYVIGWKRVVSD